MIIDTKEFKKLLEALMENPEKASEIFRSHKFVHAVFEEGEGIPPRFGNNFRDEGPKWEKVTGLDFEGIGRILVSHLCIEHYLNNLIELSSPKSFDWNSSKMTFSQKLKLVNKIEILDKSKFSKGIEIINNIRNRLSHNMLAAIDESKIEQLKKIILDYRCKGKTAIEKDEIVSHLDQFKTHGIVESFTQTVCALIAGYCTSIINKSADGVSYYEYVRSPDYLTKNGA